MLVWPPERMPTDLVFISDLHLFSARSTAGRHRPIMIDLAKRAEMVVFGGDLFDLRWSRLGGHQETTRAAICWLEEFIDAAPQRQYVYLFGNHDCDPGLRDQLCQLARRRPELEIAGDWLRIGDIVLLHGDVIEGGGDAASLDRYRLRWSLKPQASLTQSRAYDAAVSVGAHRLAAALAHRRRRTFQRLLTYLTAHHLGPQAGIRRVVFGHTHRYIPGKSFGGLRFYNPGAAVWGVPFQPVFIAGHDHHYPAGDPGWGP